MTQASSNRNGENERRNRTLDWFAERRLITVTAWFAADDGHAPMSDYAECYWLPVLGPTPLAIARRLAKWLDHEGTFEVDQAELAALVGVGMSTELGRNSRLIRSMVRLTQFGFMVIDRDRGSTVRARRTFPWLTASQVRRLPDSLQGAHAQAEWERY